MRISASRLFPSSTLRLALVACLCLLVFCAQASAAGPFRHNFSYYADRQELGTVLMNFAQAEGYTAAVSPAVKGKVSGRFQDVPPLIFLDGMRSAFDVYWYTLGKTLHFYNASETTRIFISPRTGTAQQLYSARRNSAVFSPQLCSLRPPGRRLTAPSAYAGRGRRPGG